MRQGVVVDPCDISKESAETRQISSGIFRWKRDDMGQTSAKTRGLNIINPYQYFDRSTYGGAIV